MLIINVTGINREREHKPQKYIYYKDAYCRAGEIAQQLRVLIQVQSPVPTHQHTTVSSLVPRNMTLSSVLRGHCMYMVHIHAGKIPMHTNNKIIKKK